MVGAVECGVSSTHGQDGTEEASDGPLRAATGAGGGACPAGGRQQVFTHLCVACKHGYEWRKRVPTPCESRDALSAVYDGGGGGFRCPLSTSSLFVV